MGDEAFNARVGELRRLTIMFSDVVGSTELSGRQEPEAYRELMRGYRVTCRDVIESRFEGHIVQLKGDGTLSIFGFPVAHENDAERAVRAALALVRAVRELSVHAGTAAGETLEVRVAVHHGPVYVDFDEDDIYGLAANVAARLHAVAEPGTVIVSDEVRQLVTDHFDIEAGEPQTVKGVTEPIESFRVVRERSVPVQRSWSTPLVEREAELQLLRQSWTRVAADEVDRPTAMLVHGDAGMGKSRLVAALAEEVRAGNGCIVELHGSPFHIDAGFHPVRRLVEARCGIGDATHPAERLESLAREVTDLGLDPTATVPLLAPVLGVSPSAGYHQAATEGRKLEEQISEAALAYIVACTGGRPAIVVAENLHWFDGATRDLVAELTRGGSRSVLVVATSRRREDGPWEAIELSPLTLAGRLALIDALVEGMNDQDRLALATRSDGIPLYLEELTRAGSVQSPPTAGDVPPVPGSVPAALYEPLVALLYATPSALPVAATAAAAGQEVDRSVIDAATSIPAEELHSTLRDLVHARILQPVEGRADRYRFRHELLREVAYELQPPSWRRTVHSRLCDIITRDQPGDWRVLASHFERAERFHEAATAYQETAELARRRGALAEARAHLTRAIDLTMALPEDATRDHREIELRLRRGFLAMSAEGVASVDAAADFERCLEVAAADPSSDDMFSTLIALWAYYLSRAELDRTRRVSETLRAALGDGREYFRPQNFAGFGMLDWFAGDFTNAVDILSAATADLMEAGERSEISAVWFVPTDATVAMHAHLAVARFMVGAVAGAEESLGRARAIAASLDFPQGPSSTDYTCWLGAWMWMEVGRHDLAEEALDELRTSSARHGFDSWELVGATHTATFEAIKALKSGTTDAAALTEHADSLSAFIEFWQALDLRIFLPFYLTTTGALLAAAADADGARRRYAESIELAAATGMRFYDSETARRLAHLASDRDSVIAELRAALELARAQAARPFELRIALDLHRLLGEEARSLLGQAMQPFSDGGTTADLEAARAQLLVPS